ncbi:MAG TPA: agmatine deiminase family protein [Acidiferrobacteraceae bacterium]|nr:agmatine deiminase family protein [Acidiferrobacteraceae bacterium]
MKTIPIHSKPATIAGRRLPAEWEPQSGVQLTWPRRTGPWGAQRPAVEQVFLDLAVAIAHFEPLLVVVEDDRTARELREKLELRGIRQEHFRSAVAAANDVWARDHGPITVLEQGRPVLLDFRFNGWGGKYAFDDDDRITERLHDAGVFGDNPRHTVDLVLEGGSIESDGAGTLLTTESCLLSPARNPKLKRTDIEQRLRAELGAQHILWLTHGYLAGDDTDGHVDTLARLCDPHTIAYVTCPDPEDEHFAELAAMESELRALRTQTGQPYRLVPLPWPKARLNAEGDRLPATYANFLILNGAVLVPTYDDPADAAALAAIGRCFPSRTVLGVPCLPLIQQYGSLHCVTMQLPSGVLP